SPAPRCDAVCPALHNGALKCTFSAPGHSTSLLQGLATLRAQGQLLDVVLTINREVFHAHKVVLAACSDYFRAMFTGGMREASQDVIELKGVSARGLRHIIDFAYSAEVTLDLDCVQDVLGAAVFLQMLPVVELCEDLQVLLWGAAGLLLVSLCGSASLPSRPHPALPPCGSDAQT
uniref:BTB domain-containing protein n=1 Tax=Spermophilus dauricus TaxID=99837 RepID=A0A8C9PT00_SPEDA